MREFLSSVGTCDLLASEQPKRTCAMSFVSLLPASLENRSRLSHPTSEESETQLRLGKGALFAAILLATIGFAQRSTAQATITVDTTQQGVTNGQCSIQEAIYATEFQSNTAI